LIGCASRSQSISNLHQEELAGMTFFKMHQHFFLRQSNPNLSRALLLFQNFDLLFSKYFCLFTMFTTFLYITFLFQLHLV